MKVLVEMDGKVIQDTVQDYYSATFHDATGILWHIVCTEQEGETACQQTGQPTR